MDGNPMTFYLKNTLTRQKWQNQFAAFYNLKDAWFISRVLYSNVYLTQPIWDTMNNKITKIGSYLGSLDQPCTIVIIHNLLEVQFLQVPCNKTILGK